MPAVKSSAVAAVASDLGCSDGHTPAAGEKPAVGDLLRGFDDEMSLFEGQAVRPPGRRGPGRPAGSVNRTTRQLQTFLLQRGYRDPAEFLASLVSADTKDLARELGIEDRAEVLKIQRSAAVDLMPYFHQRQTPVEGEKPQQPRPLVVILDGAGGIAARAGDLAMSVNDPQQFQTLSDIDANASHNGVSHDES